MLKLISANLKERPTRTIVSVLAVALGVALVLISVGLANGQLTEHAMRLQRIGADLLLQPPNSSHILAISSAALDERLLTLAQEVEGVADVSPVLVMTDRFKQIFGMERQFVEFSPNMEFVQGRMFQAPYETVVDTIYAENNHVALGQMHELLAHEFRIVGIYKAGTAVRVMIPLETAQELNGSPGKCSVFFIRAAADVPLETLESRLMERFKGFTIMRSAELQEIWIENTPAVKPFMMAITSIAVVVSFLVILLSMYSTITERTREIGILRSLGASKGYIVQLILKESLLICLIGVVVGFALNVVGLYLVGRAFPTLPVDTPFWWRVGAPVMAVLGGTVGSIYPAIKAARLDPVKALGYE
ncbi:MAG TPA: FtsX-like permease family protein [Acidobacteriota bacterium]|nr:FtsX-like permease family protein [Acidobacteriota bacterium]